LTTKLRLENVTKRYGAVTALRNVSFTVDRGEYVAVLGPTGAGKTTLLKVIAGLLKPDTGEVFIDGEPVSHLSPEERGVGYMPQGYGLFPHMRVIDNVAYPLRIKGLGEAEAIRRAVEVLEMVGLAQRGDAYPHQLSGGMKQRVALARALASGSDILLLDEPLSALDLLLNIELRYQLRRMAKKLGLTVLHVTHSQEEAMAVADKILVLRAGVVQQFGEPEELYWRPANLFVAFFLGGLNRVRGRVASIRGGLAIVSARRIGPIVSRNMGRVAVGDAVLACFRPEAVRLVEEELTTAHNAFSGRIEEVRFEGMFTRVIIKIDENTVIEALQIGRPGNISEGMYVTAYVDPSDVMLFHEAEWVAEAKAVAAGPEVS